MKSKINGGELFKKLSLGTLLIIISTAIFFTKGVTIFLGCFLLIFFIPWKKIILISSVNQYYSNLKKIEKEVVPVVLFLILALLFQYSDLYNIIENKEVALDGDYAFYARLISYLHDFGFENTNIELFLESESGVLPYHYSDIWFGVFLKSFLPLHSQKLLIAICYPIFLALTYSGTIYLVRFLKTKLNQAESRLDYALALTLFVISAIGALYPKFIDILKMDVWAIGITEMPKLIIVYFLLIWLFIFLINNNLRMVSVTASVIAFSYVSLVPGIFIGIGLYYSYLILLKKIKINRFFNLLMPLIFVAFYFLVFYKYFGIQSSVSLSNEEFISQFFELAYYKTFINVIGKMSIQIGIIISPFLILFLFFRKQLIKGLQPLILLSSIIIFSALITWAFLHRMHDSVQLYGNLFNPIVNISIFILITYILIQLKQTRLKQLMVFLIFSVSIFDYFFFSRDQEKNNNNVLISEQDLRQMIEEENPSFVYLRASSEYYNLHNKVEQVYLGNLKSLDRFYDPLKAVCISSLNIPVNNLAEKKFRNAQTFIKYYNSQKGKGLTESKLQLQFIEEFSIDYLLMSENRQIPLYFNELFDLKKIGVIDNYSVFKRKDI